MFIWIQLWYAQNAHYIKLMRVWAASEHEMLRNQRPCSLQNQKQENDHKENFINTFFLQQ